MVRFCTLFNAENHTVTFLNGQTYPLSTLRALGMGSLLDAMFEFSEKLGSLGLEPDEMALFMAVVLVSAGREGTLFNDKCCTQVVHQTDNYVSPSHSHFPVFHRPYWDFRHAGCGAATGQPDPCFTITHHSPSPRRHRSLPQTPPATA